MGIDIRVSYQGKGSKDVSGLTRTLREAGKGLTIGRDRRCDLVLPDSSVSRKHAVIRKRDRRLYLFDEGSANGIKLDGRRVAEVLLERKTRCEIGPFTLTIRLSRDEPRSTFTDEVSSQPEDGATVVVDRSVSEILMKSPVGSSSKLPPVFQSATLVESDLAATPLDVTESVYGVVGGGLGSFIFVDHLRCYGVPAHYISVVGLESQPYHKYRRLCRNSQIPDHERLRSNSESCPDNIWGYPGYAFRESFRELAKFRLHKVFYPLWQVFWEPVIESYTPKAGDVFDSVDREAKRIGWQQMLTQGRVQVIRKTDQGRYAVLYAVTGPDGVRRNAVILCDHVHLALGYPGTRLLADLQKYRARTEDHRHVVNAYEDHDHVYEDLAAKGGTVVLRGRGIVASRIIQRIYEARQKGANIRLIHLMRSKVFAGAKYGSSSRLVKYHWEYQPFNWPKSCWGGELRSRLEKADDQKRAELYRIWGGTTTADRNDWKRMLEDGVQKNWYIIRFGSVEGVEPLSGGGIRTLLSDADGLSEVSAVDADYIVDCTGLVPDIQNDGLINDLVTTYNVPRNSDFRPDGTPIPKGLQVDRFYEVNAMENGRGRFFAAGQITAFGPMAAVDSFLGLQYSAIHSVKALKAAQAPGIKTMHWFRSLFQWFKWVFNATP